MISRVRPRYRSRREVPVGVWITFAAPGSAGAEALLPAGETIEIRDLFPAAERAFARPERYAELEAVIVPKADREWPTYGGYSLTVDLRLLESDFDVQPCKPGDHPVADILDHGLPVFAPAIDDLVRQLARWTHRCRLWDMFEWTNPPALDDLEGLLRWQLDRLVKAAGGPDSTVRQDPRSRGT